MVQAFARSALLAAYALLLATPAPAHAVPTPRLEFIRDGKTVKSFTLADLKRDFAPRETPLVEPHELVSKSFEAVDFHRLLDAAFGPEWRTAKTLVARCADGYRPILKVETLVAGEPWLAFALKGEPEFSIAKAGKTTKLAPYYLVWTQKMENSERLRHLGAGNWPYQVFAFELR